MVADTVWHEIAHYFGMDEVRVRKAVEKARRTGDPLLHYGPADTLAIITGLRSNGIWPRASTWIQIREKDLSAPSIV